MIIGHRKIVDFFENAIPSGNLASTYCFVGASQVGKRTVANFLAAKLLGVQTEKLSSHPDFHYVERVEDDKTGKLKKNLSVAQARDIRSRLQFRSWLGGYQAMLIDEAELLNEEAGNALLKILEEPPQKSVIILLTENELALPATIRSRSQMFYFPLVAKKEIEEGLKKLGNSSAEADRLSALAWGRPGRAIELANDKDLQKDYLSEVDRWKKMIGLPFYGKLKIIESIFGNKEDAVRGRDHLREVLDIWIMQFREMLLGGKNASFNVRDLQKIIDSLGEAKILLGKNIHPRLLVENAILKF